MKHELMPTETLKMALGGASYYSRKDIQAVLDKREIAELRKTIYLMLEEMNDMWGEGSGTSNQFAIDAIARAEKALGVNQNDDI